MKIKNIRRVNDELIFDLEKRVNLKDCSLEFVEDVLDAKEELINGEIKNGVLISTELSEGKDKEVVIEKTVTEIKSGINITNAMRVTNS